MKTEGYIKSYRPQPDDELYFEEPFTKWQAWHDLLYLTAFKDTFIFVRGIKVEIKRGQVAASERFLADRWKWSRGKVKRFFELLTDMQRIVPQETNVTTLISIVNYCKYQDYSTTDDTTNDTTNSTTDDTTNSTNNKNVKNDKNEKNTPPIIPPYDGRVGFEFFGTFKNVELKPAELRKLQMDFGETETQSAINDLSCKLMDGSTESNAHYATLTYWLANRRKKKLREKESQPKGRDLIGNDDEFTTDNTYQQ